MCVCVACCTLSFSAENMSQGSSHVCVQRPSSFLVFSLLSPLLRGVAATRTRCCVALLACSSRFAPLSSAAGTSRNSGHRAPGKGAAISRGLGATASVRVITGMARPGHRPAGSSRCDSSSVWEGPCPHGRDLTAQSHVSAGSVFREGARREALSAQENVCLPAAEVWVSPLCLAPPGLHIMELSVCQTVGDGQGAALHF